MIEVNARIIPVATTQLRTWDVCHLVWCIHVVILGRALVNDASGTQVHEATVAQIGSVNLKGVLSDDNVVYWMCTLENAVQEELLNIASTKSEEM